MVDSPMDATPTEPQPGGDYVSPVIDVDVTDAYEPQVAPDGAQLRCVYEPKTLVYDRTKCYFKMRFRALEIPAPLDPTRGLGLLDYMMSTPNPAKDDAARANDKKWRLQQFKTKLGLLPSQPLSEETLTGRVFVVLARHQKQDAAQEARFGKRAEVAEIVSVE